MKNVIICNKFYTRLELYGIEMIKYKFIICPGEMVWILIDYGKLFLGCIVICKSGLEDARFSINFKGF